MLDTIPNLDISARSSFRLFAALIPRLVPIDPFLELCDGYETDTQFAIPQTQSPHSPVLPNAAANHTTRTRSRRVARPHTPPPSLAGPSTPPPSPLKEKVLHPETDLQRYLPIKTTQNLMEYADDVAGSIASAICYLSWSILDTPTDPANKLEPVLSHLKWSHNLHRLDPDADSKAITPLDAKTSRRKWVVERSREMGRALQLVNISRDIAKDALIGRLYIQLSAFPSAAALADILFPSSSNPPSYAPYTLPTLDMADRMREESEGAIEYLPRTAKGGTRAMAASYFEIGAAIRAQGGEVDEKGVRVSKVARAFAAAKAMWIGGWGS